MSNSTINKDQLTNDSTEEFEIQADDKINYKEALSHGVKSSLFTFIAVLLFALLMNFLSFGLFLLYIWNILYLASVAYFFSAAMVIWFGPSPQWNALKAKYRNRSVKFKTTTESLQDGLGKVIAGFILIFIVLA